MASNSLNQLMAGARKALEAQTLMRGIKTPVKVEISFYFKRYQKHYNSDGTVRLDCPDYFSGKPDLDTQDCCIKARFTIKATVR